MTTRSCAAWAPPQELARQRSLLVWRALCGLREPSMIGEDQPNVDGPPHSRRLAVGASVSIHIVVGALAIWLSTLPRSFAAPKQAQSPPRHDLIWIASPGPGGGGGGGGDQTTVAAPARRLGPDRLTVPTTRPEPKPMRTPKEPPPIAPPSPPPARCVGHRGCPWRGESRPVSRDNARSRFEGAPEAAVALAAGKGRARDSVPASEAESGEGPTGPAAVCRCRNWFAR